MPIKNLVINSFQTFFLSNSFLLAFIFPVQANNATTSEVVDETPLINESIMAFLHENQVMNWGILILLIVGLILLQRGKHLYEIRKLLNAKFANFTIDNTHQKICLYQRHDKNIAVKLPIKNLIKSEIFLNDKSITSINAIDGLGFSATKEQALMFQFSTESRDKMLEDKKRKIEMVLIDDKYRHYKICLYFRKGDQRYTRKKYDDVIAQLIEWSWLVALTITPKETTPRIINTAGRIQPNQKKHQKNAVSAQVTPGQVDNIKTPSVSTKHINNEAVNEEKKASNSQVTIDGNNKSTQDIELINTLDKLTKLKQEGYLSDAEFSVAKAKILQNLVNN